MQFCFCLNSNAERQLCPGMVFYEKTEIKNLLSELVLETVDDLSVDLRLGLACGGGTSSPFFNLSSDFAPFKEL
jgi:hypothetical protein